MGIADWFGQGYGDLPRAKEAVSSARYDAPAGAGELDSMRTRAQANTSDPVVAARRMFDPAAGKPLMGQSPAAGAQASADAGGPPVLAPASDSSLPLLSGGGGGGVTREKVSTTISKGVELPAEVRDDFARARGEAESAIELRRDADLAAGDADAQHNELRAGFHRSEQTVDETREGGRRMERGDAKRAVESAERDYAADKIDPDHYWNNAGTGKKVASVIGLALGGFGAALTGGRNGAMDLFQAAIDRDMASQNANRSAKLQTLQSKRASLADLDKDQDQARANEARQRMMGWKAIDAQLASTEPALKGQPAALAKAQEMRAQFHERIGIEGAKLADLTHDKVVEQHQTSSGPGAGGVGAGTKEMQWLSEQLGKAEIPETNATAGRVMRSFGSNDVAGVGPVASRVYEKAPAVYASMYGADAAKREQEWHSFRNQAIKSLSGSGVSGAEMSRMESDLDGARSPEARRNAASNVQRVLRAKEANVRSGASPEANALYDVRRQAYGGASGGGGAPPGFKPAGSK